MPNVSIKISQLQRLTGSYITADDFIPVVDSGSLRTYKMTLGDMATFVNTNVSFQAIDTELVFNQGGVYNGSTALTFNYVSSSLQNGINVTASALGSHAEGFGSNVTSGGYYSHAEGYNTYTYGVGSHSEGVSTAAYGNYSHAQGSGSAAYGTASFAGGNNTTANGNYQTVVGAFNTPSSKSTDLFIVGNGTSASRSNIVLINTASVIVNGYVSASSFTGSVFGTSSWAKNVISASYALNGGGGSSLTTGSTYPITSSWAVSSSYAQLYNIITSSITSSIVSSSYASSSFSASYALTASYALNGGSGGSGVSSSYFSGSVITASNAKIASTLTALGVTATGTVQGATLTSTGNINIGTAGYILNPNGNSVPYSNIIGNGAGLNCTTFNGGSTTDCNFFGQLAGGTNYANTLGGFSYNNFFGYQAGYASNAAVAANYGTNNNFIGYQAGYVSIAAGNTYALNSSNFIGYQAGSTTSGTTANGAGFSNFFGYLAGQNAVTAAYSNFLGYNAGQNATNAAQSNFLGTNAGQNATSATNCCFIGQNAGQNATNAANSNFIGGSGAGATNASYSTFVGTNAGANAVNASGSIFIGNQAGSGAAKAPFSIFIGYNSGLSDTVTGSASNGSILIGNYTNTKGFSGSISIGNAIGNTAHAQANIGNVFYINGIQTGNTNTTASISTAKVGIGVSNPTTTLHVSGSISSSGLITPLSSSAIPSLTGSIFYSSSKLWVFTGTSNNYGAGTGWSTASVSI